MGFADVTHFWEPWCVALVRDSIAAIAFAARLGESGAEIGVVTLPEFRGRRLAAAVTAGWSSLPQLGERELFYSTTRDNVASQHVIARLGLPLVGVSMRLG
jgi:predicted GNAT family acetyltransferase